MTRRDYLLLAAALQRPCTESDQETRETVLWVSQFVADVLLRDNPRFDRDHFLAVVRGEKSLTSRPPR